MRKNMPFAEQELKVKFSATWGALPSLVTVLSIPRLHPRSQHTDCGSSMLTRLHAEGWCLGQKKIYVCFRFVVILTSG